MTLNEYLQKNYSKSSFKSNQYNIKCFTNYYGNKAALANYTEVLNYIEHLRKNYDLHPKTLRIRLQAVKIYFNYLLAIGKRSDHPCNALYLKDKIDKQIHVETLYQSDTLEEFFESYEIKRKVYLKNRNKIIISLLIYQALTALEIVQLTIENIDLEKGKIVIKGTSNKASKSPKSRNLPLQAKQVLLIYNYLKNDRKELLKRNPQNPQETTLILSQYGQVLKPHGISRIINENRAEKDKIKPIKIRQSVIANLLKKENDVRVVQVFAGHRKASTTAQYKLTALEILQKAVIKYHPLN